MPTSRNRSPKAIAFMKKRAKNARYALNKLKRQAKTIAPNGKHLVGEVTLNSPKYLDMSASDDDKSAPADGKKEA